MNTEKMEYIDIEGLPLKVSKIALGTWAIGGWMWGGADDDESVRTIRAALDGGINLIDTAPVYGFGRAEEIVGRALAGGRRRHTIIATKAGMEWRDGRVFRNSSPERLRRELEESLRRLGTDFIDIYQVHWPDEKTPIEETAAAMEGFRHEGKVRIIGVSNYAPAQMDRFMTASTLRTVQPPYNLFERQIESELLTYASGKNLTVLAYGSLCRGLLSGGMDEGRVFTGDDIRKFDPKFKQPRFAQYLAAVRKLDDMARRRFGRGVLALAVRWLIDRENVIALWGARRPDQLAPIGDVIGWSIDDDALKEIDRILDETVTDPVGPEFMSPPGRDI